MPCIMYYCICAMYMYTEYRAIQPMIRGPPPARPVLVSFRYDISKVQDDKVTRRKGARGFESNPLK